MSEETTISFDTDHLLSKMCKWKADEAKRASSAAETRQDIGQLLEDTNLNKKALAWVRALDKMDEDKRAEVLRSLDEMLDELRPHWAGQSTADMFTDAPEPPVLEGKSDVGSDARVVPFDPDIQEDSDDFDSAADEETERPLEAAEFDAAVDEAMAAE